ncbi:MAG: radical SAM protein [Candidatus Methylomirabilales bacterium]
MSYQAYSISWNLTQRCNLRCAHCYMSAFAGADASQELTTEECRQVMDGIAQVNPNVFLILTGGEPLLRKDLFDLAAYATEKGFTVVLGTNGVLLRERQARLMRQSGVQGASISLDSTDPKQHDVFHRLPGAWQGAVRATEVLRAEGIDFSIHTSVTSWNVEEIPAMIDLAGSLQAKVLNFFFLVRTGRGRDLTDVSPDTYERILTYLARVQGVGDGQRTTAQEASVFDRQEDPWSVPTGKVGRLLIRAKCAPHFRRVIYALDPESPFLRNYAHGSCPAGKYYCRIIPNGGVTPCPYMPVVAGNLRQQAFSTIWGDAAVFNELRDRKLGGRCGICEFSKICGGCRCRAYATWGDYLAEDPACSYQPGRYGGRLITLPEIQTFGLEVKFELPWEEAAKARLAKIPSFARGMVVKAVEAFARSKGSSQVTSELLQEAKERWAGDGRYPFAARS